MNKTTFDLGDHEFIELNKLLKVLNLTGSGGEANIRIDSGEVIVNNETETRKRKKLYPRDIVVFDNHEIRITNADNQ